MSEVYKRYVDLGAFASYLAATCTEDSIKHVRASYYFTTYKKGIERMASGVLLWGNDDQAIVALRTWVEDAVLIQTSNTQFVELCVKEEHMIGTCNRSVSLRSIIAIIRTCTIRKTNINAVGTARSRPLAANQFVKKGINGERECL